MDVPYTDSSFSYEGRWVESAEGGMSSRWQGAKIRFKVSGTGSIVFRVNVKDLNSTPRDQSAAAVSIDGGDLIFFVLSTEADVFDGEKSFEIKLPDSGSHSIDLKLPAWPESQIKKRNYVSFLSVKIDDDGVVSSSAGSERVKILAIGDSWLSVKNDWSRKLDQSKYSIYPVSFGGASMANLDDNYLGDFGVDESALEPKVDLVIIAAGVNDYHANVSAGAFAASAESLVNKVMHIHPSAKIKLLQAPDNIVDEKSYGKYASALIGVADKYKNVDFSPFPEDRLSDLKWMPDGSHLTPESLGVYSEIVEMAID